MENIKPVESGQLEELARRFSPFLNEARKRLFFTLYFFVISMIAGFVLYEKIIKIIIQILNLQGINIVFTSPFQFINLAITCGLATGVVLSLPVFLYQIMYFLKPALKNREFRMMIRFLPFCIFLFLTGFAFGIFIMRWQIQIFLTTSNSIGIGNILDISHLLSTVLVTSAFLGLGFEFPIILLLLLRFRILKPEQLKKQRIWVYLGSFLFAILLPVDSIIADVLLSLPLVILFEITLVLNRVLERRKIG